MGLVMTGYSVCVFKAIMVDCLFFARLPVEVEHGSSPPGSKGQRLVFHSDVSGRLQTDCVACQVRNWLGESWSLK